MRQFSGWRNLYEEHQWIIHHFSTQKRQPHTDSTGLKVNYEKSVMIPINVLGEKMEILAGTFSCKIGAMPFPYLGLPLGTTKPSVSDCLPMVQRIERRLIGCSQFLTQAGKLEMVNTVLSSMPTFHMCSLLLYIEVLNQADKYRRHCIWRGSDINAKKPPLAAWSLVTRPKSEGGLGVLNLRSHNEALLMKHLHKFYNKADLPWVKLVWDNYYQGDKLPGQQRKGSFWWRDIIKLLDQFKGITSVKVGDGSTVMLWNDGFKNIPLKLMLPELFSFVKNENILLSKAKATENIFELFHLPLSEQAFQQVNILQGTLQTVQLEQTKDIWSHMRQNGKYSASKVYKQIVGHFPTHRAFQWLWSASCQPKHKVFFWLIMQDRLNTRGTLKRRNMHLDSYTCEMCIMQREETIRHLFIRCNFAQRCWEHIGINLPRHLPTLQLLEWLRNRLTVPFFMDIIILMCWSIWITRNKWIFEDTDPTVEECRRKFFQEIALVVHRAKLKNIEPLQQWIQQHLL